MRRMLLCLLVAAAACAATSCRRAVERSASKIRIEAVGRPVVLGPTAFELPLTVDNGSAHRLRLEAASLALRCGDARALELRLAGEVCIERRTRVEVVTRWRMRIADPLALYVVVERLRISCLCRRDGVPDRRLLPRDTPRRSFPTAAGKWRWMPDIPSTVRRPAAALRARASALPACA